MFNPDERLIYMYIYIERFLHITLVDDSCQPWWNLLRRRKFERRKGDDIDCICVPLLIYHIYCVWQLTSLAVFAGVSRATWTCVVLSAVGAMTSVSAWVLGAHVLLWNTHTHTQTNTHTHIHIHTHTCMHPCTHIHTQTHTYTRMHAHIHKHKHKHTHTHTSW